MKICLAQTKKLKRKIYALWVNGGIVHDGFKQPTMFEIYPDVTRTTWSSKNGREFRDIWVFAEVTPLWGLNGLKQLGRGTPLADVLAELLDTINADEESLQLSFPLVVERRMANTDDPWTSYGVPLETMTESTQKELRQIVSTVLPWDDRNREGKLNDLSARFYTVVQQEMAKQPLRPEHKHSKIPSKYVADALTKNGLLPSSLEFEDAADRFCPVEYAESGRDKSTSSTSRSIY